MVLKMMLHPNTQKIIQILCLDWNLNLGSVGQKEDWLSIHSVVKHQAINVYLTILDIQLPISV